MFFLLWIWALICTPMYKADVSHIIAKSGMDPSSISVRIVYNPTPNAFAGIPPNSNKPEIIAQTGLWSLPENERIFILNHELGHIANHDSQRFQEIEQQFGSNVFKWTIGGSVLPWWQKYNEQGADMFAQDQYLKGGYNLSYSHFKNLIKNC